MCESDRKELVKLQQLLLCDFVRSDDVDTELMDESMRMEVTFKNGPEFTV